MSKNHSILLGKYIYKALSTDEELKPLLNGKIYPIVAENSTLFPYLVYYRTSIQNISQNKDGLIEDLYTFDVVVVSNKYEDGLQISNIARNTLERLKHIDNDTNISYIKLIDGEENYSDNSYIQKLTFQASITN